LYHPTLGLRVIKKKKKVHLRAHILRARSAEGDGPKLLAPREHHNLVEPPSVKRLGLVEARIPPTLGGLGSGVRGWGSRVLRYRFSSFGFKGLGVKGFKGSVIEFRFKGLEFWFKHGTYKNG